MFAVTNGIMLIWGNSVLLMVDGVFNFGFFDVFSLVCSKKHQPFSAAQGDDGSTQSNQTLAPTVTAATGAADCAETLPSVSLTWRSTDATGVQEGLVVYGYLNLFE